MGERKRPFDLNLAVQLLLIVVLCVSCVLMVHLTMLTRRISDDIERNSENVAAIAATAKRIAEQVDALELRASRWLKVARADEVVSAVDEAAKIGEALVGEAVEADPAARAEIAHLLSTVGRSGLEFEYAGKSCSATRFYLQLLAKHKAYEKTLASAEDFIAKVATKTVTGKTYHVLAHDGTKRELAAWLTEALRQHRARGRE